VLLEAAGELLGQAPEMRLQIGQPREVGIEGGLRADGLRLARRIDPPIVLAACPADQRRTILADAAPCLPIAQGPADVPAA
jgi:hypothetical protein